MEIAQDAGAALGVGHDACVHKLISMDNLNNFDNCVDVANDAASGNLTIITPITPQNRFDLVLDYICDVVDTGVCGRIVVNDLGVLYAMHEVGLCNEFDAIIAGRGIVHTSESIPWVDHILRDEAEEIKDAFLKTNVNYTKTLDLYRRLGVTEIETDMLPRTMDAIRELPCPVGAHVEYSAVAYTRSCHASRFFLKGGTQPPACVDMCNEPLTLSLRDMFDLNSTPPGFAQPSDELVEVFPELYLLGNGVFMKSDCRDVAGIDRVIVDGDMYSDEGLLEIVGSLS